MSKSLDILNKNITDMYECGWDMTDNNNYDKDLFGSKVLDVVRSLYDVYMDDEAYIYSPYFGYMPVWITDEGFGIQVYTIPESRLPKESGSPIKYKKELFRDKVDFVYSNLDKFWLCLNPDTVYRFDVYDWNLEYIMARKDGATSFPLLNDDGDIDGYLTW